MHPLIVHAKMLGVTLQVASLPHPYQGFYNADTHTVVYDYGLTPIERRCVVAHELGHAFYGHRAQDNRRFEDAADLYAAKMLIRPDHYASAERLSSSVETLAEELQVTPDLVEVFQKKVLLRLRGVTYAAPRMGAGQYAWKWA